MNTIKEYVDWRAQWRRDYKELSDELRIDKMYIRDTMRGGGYAGTAQYELIFHKERATKMLIDRKIAKARAIDLWAKEKLDQ
ncbi:hypothetical protein [Acinetobacter sp.]|uniref:hypothetical protein n=1 Tax=Acinetobacter sp. TaxID=472 RepID=UPI0037504936